MKHILLTAGAAIIAMAGYAGAQPPASRKPVQRTARQERLEQRLRQRLDLRFARLDKNQDGVVSKDEWPGRPAVFDRIDTNHDGALSKDEVQQAMRERVAQLRQRVQRRVDALFARADKNQDGVISRDEWPGSAARFDRFDLNHDGVLSKDEVRPVLSRRVLRRLAVRRLLTGG